MNTPAAFTETYWSINSLRIYNASGKPAKSSSLSAGAIAGIVIGSIVGLGLIVCLVWRWRKRRNSKRAMNDRDDELDGEGGGNTTPKHSFLATSSGANLPVLPGGGSASSSRSNSKKGRSFGISAIPKNPKGNIQANGYAREGKTTLAPGKSARHYLAGETPLAPKIPDENEGISRRGSSTSGPKAFSGGGDWVALASGGSRRGSQAPSLGGKGWVG
jgi:hypothetical protein